MVLWIRWFRGGAAGMGPVLLCFRLMNPDMRLVIAGAILLVALAFFFFGQSLVDAPDDIENATPTPTAFFHALRASTS